MIIVDAHLDLAWNALQWNRNLQHSVYTIRTEESNLSGAGRGQGTVALPEMRRGRVALCFGTLLARSTGRPIQNLDYSSPYQAYAVAQGTVQTGSVSASGASGSSISKGVPTAGRIAGGAIVEREIGFQLASMPQLRMTLRNPDFTTARRIAEAINAKFPGCARADNPTIVTIQPAPGYNMVSFISQVENMPVDTDEPANARQHPPNRPLLIYLVTQS